MALGFSYLFGGNNKKSVEPQSTKKAQMVATPEQKLPQMDSLLFRASHNFIKYMNDFLQTGKSVGLPVARLSRDEWDALNKKLLPYGAKLVLREDKGGHYMWFEHATDSVVQTDNSNSANLSLEQLMMRASKNFTRYKQEFLNGSSVAMFPASRMSQSDWNELNRLIADQGIRFVSKEYNGVQYMKFSHIVPQNRDASTKDNGSAFQAAIGAVKVMAFDSIKQRYPNLSDEVVQYMVDNKQKLNEGDIYGLVRHALRPYSTSQSEFIKAANYGSNDTDNVRAFSYQKWTWSRQAKKRVPRQSDYCGYHLSLNVHVSPGLIAALDNVLTRDMGRYIVYYKFPKADYFR